MNTPKNKIQSAKDILNEGGFNQIIQFSPENRVQYYYSEIKNDFGNGNPKTEDNLQFLVSRAIETNKTDLLMKIRSEVKADSNSNTRSKTAVFISRCLKELGIKGDGDSFTATEKWIYKALHVKDNDLLCNTDMFLELGRYEKKTVNEVKLIFNNDLNSYLNVLFEITPSQHDDEKERKILEKPFGKLEVLLEMAIHREFIKQYAIYNQKPETSILKYEEVKPQENFLFKRPYIVLPTSTIREWIWGKKNNGNVMRALQSFLKFNRERLSLEIGNGTHIPEGYLKVKSYTDAIRPYEIKVIKIELDTIQGKREANGFKITMHEFFFDMLIKLHQSNKYKPDIFTKLRELSEREIKLYLLVSKYESYKTPFVCINDELLKVLGIDLDSKQKDKNTFIRRTVANLNSRNLGIKLTISPDYSKINVKRS